VTYLLFDIAVLWACFAALGPLPPLATLVLGYQIGYWATSSRFRAASGRSTAG
jgi:hypothetical protein